MQSLDGILKQHWGFDAFLPLQREAMESVLEGRDSLVILPTGGGKSLCFQAPAIAMTGMAVVVSPLISLMKDQVDALRANGVRAAALNSALKPSERNATLEDISAGTVKLLYVSPERIVQPGFISLLGRATPAFIVIDEAHCISHWGHDFRTEYRELRHVREAFPGVGMHAYTATATEHVRNDIVAELRLRDPRILIGSFDRPNLIYAVEQRSDAFQQVRRTIDEHPDESGIIYCIRRAEVDALCKRLAGEGYKVLPYHAGMDDATRKKNQDAFARDEVNIIVATIAFGMGIDKSNVRYVVHAGMPKSIEHYLQESGRAGRDGLPADCRLLYSYGDFAIWKSFADRTEGEPGAVALDKLRDMLRFCEAVACRHKALVGYFGETYPDRSCNACDVCLSRTDVMENAEGIAHAILSCILEVASFAGPTYTGLILTGSREERIAAKGHQRLKTYGALSEHEPRAVRDWIEQLVGQGYLEKTGEYNILHLTQRGHAAWKGRDTPRLARKSARVAPPRKPMPRTPAKKQTAGPFDKALFEALRRTRRAKAEELGVPPFVVFSDATLRDMAGKKPKDQDEFLGVHGVGLRKCEAFADDFLRTIREYI